MATPRTNQPQRTNASARPFDGDDAAASWQAIALHRSKLAAPLLALGALWLAGCVSPAGGTLATATTQGSAGAADSPCNPLLDVEGCHGTEQMLCDNGTKSWQPFDECAAPKECVEGGMASLPGAYTTYCELPPPDPVADAGGSDGVIGGGGNGDPPTTDLAVCKRWNADRADMSEGTWSGNLTKCESGEATAAAKDNALRLVNLYRWLTGLPAVSRDPALDASAQDCALIMAANGDLSHTPPDTWKCWNASGSGAAKKSNISTAPGVTSVDRYMVDSGAHNHDTLGHRRWILSRSLGPIGIGTTATKSSCLHVIGGDGGAKVAWIGWPPAGKVPLAAFAPYKKESIDSTGWSIQSDSVLLTGATVSILDDAGNTLKTEQWPLGSGYGSKYAIGFRPVGWKTEGGRVYTVEIGGIKSAFSYDVDVVDCK